MIEQLMRLLAAGFCFVGLADAAQEARPEASAAFFVDMAAASAAGVVVSATSAGQVVLHDLASGGLEAVGKIEGRPVRVAISPGGEFVAVLDDQRRLHVGSSSLERFTTNEELVDDGEGGIRWRMGVNLRFSPRGDRLLADVGLKQALVTDVDGATISTVQGTIGAWAPSRFRWGPSGDAIFGIIDGAVQRFDASNGAAVGDALDGGPSALALALAVHPEGDFVAVGYGDGALLEWDLERGEVVRSWQHEDPMGFDGDQFVGWVGYDPRGDRLAFTTGSGVFLGIVHCDSAAPPSYSEYCGGRMGEPASLAWDPAGNVVWWAFTSGAMQVHRRGTDGVARGQNPLAAGMTPSFDGAGHGVTIAGGRLVTFDAETHKVGWTSVAAALPDRVPGASKASKPLIRGSGSLRSEELYTKSEHRVAMRDGVQLHTTVYVPKALDEPRGVLLKRTPYSCRPYGEGAFPALVGPSEVAMEHGFIVVYQDVRGRWMSDGTYDNMRPHVPGDAHVDESSDTYDTIEWILENVEAGNGRVGMWGISYPGFYCTAALPEHHPALVCSSPQASIGDFFFDDFHHQGAFLLSYLSATPVFGHQKAERHTSAWYPRMPVEGDDAYRFFLEMGPLSAANDLLGDGNVFWRQIREHPSYDSFWQARSIVPHLSDVQTNTLIVGGWYDAEDLWGPLHIYQALERDDPGGENRLVMGPWSHGDWARSGSRAREQVVGDLNFGTGLSDAFAEEVELPFFVHHLEGGPDPELPEALVYDTGLRRWERFDAWPPRAAELIPWFLRGEGALASGAPSATETPVTAFVSDPAKPVPYREEVPFRFTPRPYMGEDQAFALGRPDVLVFETEPLEEDVTLAGPITARLVVSTTGTDADWVVKLVDRRGEAADKERPEDQMVRSEVARARFRKSLAQPEPLEPGVPTEVAVELQDVLHTFKAGHRIAIHVQSTWFPLIDRNPQTFVGNIYEAQESDFQVQTHTVHHSVDLASRLDLMVLRR